MTHSTGKLTTHVLDTAQGRPAAGMTIELWGIDGTERILLVTTVTNTDGRTNTPMRAEGQLQAQTYELVFHVGDYFRQQTLSLPQRLFLDRIPIRFGIDDPHSHYHVPLLVSPWAYSTYRGS
ncbi:MAG: hydroxyisourate hydrolase [Cyanobacteria bacterium P01_F01_bin.33]